MYKNVGYAPEPALLELGVRFRRMALPDTERKYRAFHPTPTPTLAPRSAYCVASRDASDLAGNILLGLANIEIQAGREPTGAQLIVPNGDRKKDLSHGTWNFVVAARGADPSHHHTSSHIPSLKFGSNNSLLIVASDRAVLSPALTEFISSAIYAGRNTYEFHYTYCFHS
jgi:hypothetical protein